MPKPGFPWAAGTFTTPYWRSRHSFSADTIPPSYPAGPAGLTTRVPYLETGPVTPDGVYHADSRAVGLHEPVTSPVVNRGLIGVQESVDMLREKDDAVPTLSPEPAVAAPPGPPYKVDTSGWATQPLVYLGPETTQAVGGPPPAILDCSSYIKIRSYANEVLRGVGSGAVLEVVDVTSAPAGISLYANLPSEAEVYPRGTPGVLGTVVGAGITFTGGGGGTAPSGTPAPPGAPAPSGVCFFNYSHWERMVHDGTTETDAFAICLTSVAGVAGAPDTYTLNRNAAALGWLPSDYVYTTHFAWGPTLNLSAELLITDVALLHGTFAGAGFGPTERFAHLMRLGDGDSWDVPLTVADLSGLGAFQYSWDRTNALFRADDLTAGMAGTVGFDHETGEAVRPHAGFLQRARLAFDNTATTILAVGEACSFNQLGRTVTLVNAPHPAVPAAQFHGGGPGGVRETHLIPGVDLVELVGPTGLRAVFLLEAMVTQSTCTVRCLDGSMPPATFPSFGAGTLTIYRPSFRTGAFTDQGTIPAGYPDMAGLVAVGDYSSTTSGPALTMLSGGYRYLLEGYCYPGDTRQNAVGTGVGLGPVFGVGVDPMPTPTRAFFEYGAHGLDHALTTRYTTSALHRVTALETDEVPANVTRTRSIIQPWRTWASEAGFVLEVRSVSAAADTVEDASFRIAPTFGAAATTGLSKPGVPGQIDYKAELYLGDPDEAYGAAGPNYGRVVAGPYGGAPGSRIYCGLVAHRDGEVAADDLVAWVVEGAAGPPIIPSRFQITSSMEFAWTEARTFYQHIALSDGLPLVDNPAVAPWSYGTVRSITPAPAECIRWRNSNGELNDVDAVDFPLNLPQGAVIQTVEVLYWRDAWAGGGASRPFGADLYLQTPPWNVPAAPTKTLSASGTATMAALYEVVTITPGAWDTIDNSSAEYWVRIRSAYDAGGVPLTVQNVMGIRVTYELRDFLPA